MAFCLSNLRGHQLTPNWSAGVKRKREPDQASQLIPFKSAASELVAMLLNTPIPQLQRPAEGTSEAAPEPTSSRTARLRCEMPMAADKSSSQQDMLTFVPMASSGGVEAMPAISPFTSAAEHAFDRPALPAQVCLLFCVPCTGTSKQALLLSQA